MEIKRFGKTSALGKFQIINKIKNPLKNNNAAKIQCLNATQIATELKKF